MLRDLAKIGFVVALAAISATIGGVLAMRLIETYPAYRGLVVEKRVDPLSMFLSDAEADYIIVVRDSAGRESTHFLMGNADEGWLVEVGDSVAKTAGFFNVPHVARVQP
jgi:uncharacterized membrane protein